ncbi:MAG: hypothetical protein QOG48_2127 [Verrucomicrobiota bacterium]|jgi:hypothetical protein
MNVFRRETGLELSEIDPFLAELLRQIPESANTDDAPAAKARLFSAPVDESEQDFREEWKQYVQPELAQLFRSSGETVAADLKQLCGKERTFANRTLRIPNEHADAWLNALNQARLAIAARNDFTEGELGDCYRSPIGSRRDLSLFQVNFYGFLQEVILRELSGCGDNGADQ